MTQSHDPAAEADDTADAGPEEANLAPEPEAPPQPSPDEVLFQATLAEFRNPTTKPASPVLLLALFVFFVLGEFKGLASLPGIAILVVVVLLHEAGHAAAMRAFGFRDVRMFFLPFFGAAVAGKPRGAAAWKDALVSLAGPVPGLLLVVPLLWVSPDHPSALLFKTVGYLVYLNLFNLLPLSFLDGGRFFARVLFSRHRVLEVAFMAMGSLALAWLSVDMGTPVLALFALLALRGLPARWRLLGSASQLRRAQPTISSNPDYLGDAVSRELFQAAQTLQRGPLPADKEAVTLAGRMEALHEATVPPPGWLATLGLLLTYGVALLVGLFVWGVHSMDNGGVNWHVERQPGWHAEFPNEPRHVATDADSPVGKAEGERWRSVAHGVERFTLVRVRANLAVAPQPWLDMAIRNEQAELGMTLVADKPVQVGDVHGREWNLQRPGRAARIRGFVVGDQLYLLTASAPEISENQEHFLKSFGLQ